MAWFLHHLDLIEHYSFQYAQHILRRHSSIRKTSRNRLNVPIHDFVAQSLKKGSARLTFNNAYRFMDVHSRLVEGSIRKMI
jgi:hypothetical protein